MFRTAILMLILSGCTNGPSGEALFAVPRRKPQSMFCGRSSCYRIFNGWKIA